MKAKVVRIDYGMFDKPNNRKIEHEIGKWTGKGYTLHSHREEPLRLSKVIGVFNPFHRGHTELTFLK